MPPLVPPSKPKLTKEEALNRITSFDTKKYPVVLLGIRGYYKNSMGNPGANDRAMYDDAVAIISDNFFATFNFNTDPSRFQKGIAVLVPGIYLYKVGLHGISGPHPYEALRQHSNVTIVRDNGNMETDSDRNRFWIDIHRGGFNTTSSLGCQTVYPVQWDEFLKDVKQQMKSHGQDIIPYNLVEN